MNPYPKTVIFSNHMHEKLLVQTPWAKFFRNVYFKKALEDDSDGGIKWIIEHVNNWHSGLNDAQIELILNLVIR